MVDATNFVLLERGQPLHAFDLDKVAGAEIVVRMARVGERMVTLDGVERTLSPDDLVIADRDRASALAGVMGGGDSEISAGTTRVLLESAWFEPTGVRRTARRHGLHTEASHRFERGVDPEGVVAALDRCAAMIAELSGGTVRRGAVDVHPHRRKPVDVELRWARPGEVLGMPVSRKEARTALLALGFELRATGARNGKFRVPSWRLDVTREEDLIEEIVRLRGYDAIPETLPAVVSDTPAQPHGALVTERARQALEGAGFSEAVNFSFVAPDDLTPLAPEERPHRHPHPEPHQRRPGGDALEPAAVAPEGARLQPAPAGRGRPALRDRQHLPAARRGRGGRRSGPGGPPPGRRGERPAPPGGLVGRRRAGRLPRPEGSARGVARDPGNRGGALRARGARPSSIRARPPPWSGRRPAGARWPWASPARSTRGSRRPSTFRAASSPSTSSFAALSEAARLVPGHAGVPRFPAVLRDLAVVVANEVESRAVLEGVRAEPLVEDVTLFDVYKGAPIPEGKKNLAMAIRYRAADRTLTDAEADAAHGRIVDAPAGRAPGGAPGLARRRIEPFV